MKCVCITTIPRYLHPAFMKHCALLLPPLLLLALFPAALARPEVREPQPDCKGAPLLYPKECGSATAPSSFTAEFQTTAGSFTLEVQVKLRRRVMNAQDSQQLHYAPSSPTDASCAAQMGPHRRRQVL